MSCVIVHTFHLPWLNHAKIKNKHGKSYAASPPFMGIDSFSEYYKKIDCCVMQAWKLRIRCYYANITMMLLSLGEQ